MTGGTGVFFFSFFLSFLRGGKAPRNHHYHAPGRLGSLAFTVSSGGCFRIGSSHGNRIWDNSGDWPPLSHHPSVPDYLDIVGMAFGVGSAFGWRHLISMTTACISPPTSPSQRTLLGDCTWCFKSSVAFRLCFFVLFLFLFLEME